MASVLFLAPDDLTETVLATGALAHVISEGHDLTIVARGDAAPLLRSAPGRKTWLQPGDLVTETLARWARGRRFDVVIDGQRSLLSGFVPAARRVALTPGPILRHRAEEWAAALGADQALSPRLWVDAEARDVAAAIAPGAALLVLTPGGSRAERRWRPDRFAAVARRLADGDLASAKIVVIGAGERDASLVTSIVRSLDADGVSAVDLGQGIDLLAAAALMERATICIGNDNALSHIAAAMGAPTLTLFGPTDERVRAPFGPRVKTLRGRSLEAIASLPQTGINAAMDDISIDAAEMSAIEVLRMGGLK